ncbi:hypothetical protein CBR_g29636 [Chara braunii]|uniref:Uncharacterized protein n=1 Tax=Chara braunii TaxID=69332 RepID=A0A388LAZ8_CHABU|nr:hypothetical protein CBR_g29636 [Chara braunii]|eukprot:GBG79490.1 hypothetical protein CBR_g29636 [Chara braunii]
MTDLGLSWRERSVTGRGNLSPHEGALVRNRKSRRLDLNLTLWSGAPPRGIREARAAQACGSELSSAWTAGQSSVNNRKWLHQPLEETGSSRERGSSRAPLVSLDYGFPLQQRSYRREREILESKSSARASRVSPEAAALDCGVVNSYNDGQRNSLSDSLHDLGRWSSGSAERGGEGSFFSESRPPLLKRGCHWAGKGESCGFTPCSALNSSKEDSTSTREVTTLNPLLANDTFPNDSHPSARSDLALAEMACGGHSAAALEAAAAVGRQSAPPPVGVFRPPPLSYLNEPYGRVASSATRGVAANEMTSPEPYRCVCATAAAARPDADLAAMTIVPRGMMSPSSPASPSLPRADAPSALRNPFSTTCSDYSDYNYSSYRNPSSMDDLASLVCPWPLRSSPPPKSMAEQEDSGRASERRAMAIGHDKTTTVEEAWMEDQYNSGHKRKTLAIATTAAEDGIASAGSVLGLGRVCNGWNGENRSPTDLSSDNNRAGSPVLVPHGVWSVKEGLLGGGGGGGGGSPIIAQGEVGWLPLIDRLSAKGWRGGDEETAAAASRRGPLCPIWSQTQENSMRQQQYDPQAGTAGRPHEEQQGVDHYAHTSSLRAQIDGFAARTSQTELFTAAAAALTEGEISFGAWTEKSIDDLFEAVGTVPVSSGYGINNTEWHLEYPRKENAVEPPAEVIAAANASSLKLVKVL